QFFGGVLVSVGVAVVYLDLDIDGANGWHVATRAAPEFVEQVQAVSATKDALARIAGERLELPDFLEDRLGLFFDVANPWFALQESHQRWRIERCADGSRGILDHERHAEARQSAIIVLDLAGR